MTSELIGQLKNWAKVAFAALRETGAAVIRWITSTSSVATCETMVPVTADGNVLGMGQRYRKTSGHAPIFSLYTFFTNRRITPGPV